jgi:hypothetical protein
MTLKLAVGSVLVSAFAVAACSAGTWSPDDEPAGSRARAPSAAGSASSSAPAPVASQPPGVPPVPTAPPPPPPDPKHPVVDVIVGYGGMRATSIDEGKTWQYTTDVTLNSDCWMYRAATYGQGLFLAASTTGGFGRISTSPDGVHWRHFETHSGVGGITYGAGKFVSERFTSTDGYNFTFRQVNVSVGGHSALGFIDGTYLITGDSGGIAASTDGETFAMVLDNYDSPVNPGSGITQFATGNGIIVGIGPNRIATSSAKGMTWTNHDDYFGIGHKAQATQQSDYSAFFSVVFDGTKFVIFGRGADPDARLESRLWTSVDGLNWTVSTAPNDIGLAGGAASSHLIGLNGGGQYDPATIFSSKTSGATWTAATSFTPSSFYDFSTPQAPITNPTISDFRAWWPMAVISGPAASDPTTTPNMPASELFTHDDILATCGAEAMPPGR